MFVAKDFARRRFLAHAHFPARMHILARICVTKHYPIESLAMNIGTIPKNMPTNFQPKRLKLKLDIVEKPENRVHKLTDSNVSRRSFAGSRSSARLVHLWARSRQRGGERE